MAVRRRPGTASGGGADRPLPRACSGDPTPITRSVEELTTPSPILVFPLNALAQAGKVGFLALIYSAD